MITQFFFNFFFIFLIKPHTYMYYIWFVQVCGLIFLPFFGSTFATNGKIWEKIVANMTTTYNVLPFGPNIFYSLEVLHKMCLN